MKQIKFFMLISCLALIFTAVRENGGMRAASANYGRPLEVYFQNYTAGTWSKDDVTVKVVTRSKPDISSGGFALSFDGGGTYTPILGASSGGFFYTIEKEGASMIKLRLKSSTGTVYSDTYSVKIDKTPPTVSIKDGAVFAAGDAPCVDFYDAGSGRCSALLNGNAVQSGERIMLPGEYELSVRDNVGNVRSVNFCISG